MLKAKKDKLPSSGLTERARRAAAAITDAAASPAGQPDGRATAATAPRGIARFGRHPHRNAILGRDSTPEELDYIATGDFPHTTKLGMPSEGTSKI